VLKGVPELLGKSIHHVVAYARKDGVWLRVPLQIDEVNAQGDYVLAGGLPFTKATDDGFFDGNDEIALSGASLGDDFVLKDVPQDLVPGSAERWRLVVCRGQSFHGSVLVVSGATPPAKDPPKAAYDEKAHIVDTQLYRYVFDRKHPVLLGEVFLKAKTGPLKLIEKSAFLMPMQTPFFMPDMVFDAEDFTSEVESWQVGPVRTIVAVGVKYAAFLSLFKLHLFSELVFYENRFEIPTVIEFVFDPSSVLKPGSGLAYSLRFPPERSWEIDSNLVPLPAEDPDKVVRKGPRASSQDVYYAQGSRPEGSFLVKARVDAKAREKVPPPFLMRDAAFRSEALKKHWEWLAPLAKGGGDLGIFLDISQIGQGKYDFGLDLLLSTEANDKFTDYGSIAPQWHRL